MSELPQKKKIIEKASTNNDSSQRDMNNLAVSSQQADALPSSSAHLITNPLQTNQIGFNQNI